MTVVVYRDGVLAADSRATSKNIIVENNCKKIFKLADGSLLGLAGVAVNGLAMLAWFKNQIKLKKKKELPNTLYKGVEAIFVDGPRVWVYNHGWEALADDYTAIGSGWVLAYGALEMGASAVEAATVARNRDIYCGGRIKTLTVKKKK